MDRLASPVRRRPPSSSPVPPLLKLLSRRPVSPLIVLIIFGMSLLLWSFSFWPLLSMKQAPIRTNNVDRCPVCPPNPQRSRPPTTDAAVESGFYTHNLTLFHKPMHTFRENLWSDKRYVTSWGNAGFTNDFVTFMNLIYLGVLSERIPILPAVSKSHHVPSREDFYIGSVFDLTALSDTIRHPILEWSSVKRMDSVEEELLGCWAPWWAAGPEGHPRDCNAPKDLLIDISYTKAPHWVNFGGSDWGVRLWSLAALGFPEGYKKGVEEYKPAPSYSQKLETPPDQHLLCMDYIFYSGIIWGKDTFNSDHAPVWRFVAKHAKFLPKVNTLAKQHLEKAFGISRGKPLPPFIAMHVRRSDFETWCKSGVSREDCLPQLPAFAYRVKEIQEELRARTVDEPGKVVYLDVKHVLVTSDEPRDSPFWKEVKQYGWFSIDHVRERTEEKYGGYFPLVIDQAIHAMAIGFIGTDQSTMSMMGALRVKTWNGGVTRNVLWGDKNTDLH